MLMQVFGLNCTIKLNWSNLTIKQIYQLTLFAAEKSHNTVPL